MVGVCPRISNISKRVLTICLVFLCALFTFVSRAQTDASAVVQLGRAALSYDDYVTAISFFNRAIEARPYMSEPYYWRGVAKFSLDDYPGANADLDSAITRNPYQADYYRLRALCHINLYDYRAAIADYNRALADFPEDQSMRFNRSLCFIELKDTASIRLSVAELLHQYPKWSKAHMLHAQYLFLVGDTLRALSSIDTLLSLSPTETSAWALKARYALQHDNNQLADSLFTQAIRYDKDNHDFYVARAQARHALGRYGDALLDYDKAILLIPQHFVAHYNRGLLRSFVGDDNRAIEDFNFVLEQEPDNTLARYNRAQLFERIGNYRKAAHDFSSLIKAYPNFLYGYAARARCLRKLGNIRGALADETYLARRQLDNRFKPQQRRTTSRVRRRSDKALEQYQQLVEAESPSTRTYFNEHSGRIQNRRVERIALPMYRFVQLPPTEREKARRLYTPADNSLSKQHGHLSSAEGTLLPLAALENLSFASNPELQALIETQRAAHLSDSLPQEALRASERALALQPQLAFLHYNHGCLLAASGNVHDAISSYHKAIAIDPLLAEAYYNRAVAHLLLGENEAAVPDLSRAGELGLYRAYGLLKQVKSHSPKAQ